MFTPAYPHTFRYRDLAEACMHRELSVRPQFEEIVSHVQKLQAMQADGQLAGSLEGEWA